MHLCHKVIVLVQIQRLCVILFGQKIAQIEHAS